MTKQDILRIEFVMEPMLLLLLPASRCDLQLRLQVP
jgi:hypothetical protein